MIIKNALQLCNIAPAPILKIQNLTMLSQTPILWGRESFDIADIYIYKFIIYYHFRLYMKWNLIKPKFKKKKKNQQFTFWIHLKSKQNQSVREEAYGGVKGVNSGAIVEASVGERAAREQGRSRRGRRSSRRRRRRVRQSEWSSSHGG